MKILILDVETAPALGYIWGMHDQNLSVEMLVEEPRMLCYAAKWLGEPAVLYRAEWQKGGHRRMIESMWHLLDEADAVVHFNGVTFDVPWLQTEFALLGFAPPQPYRQIDLLRAVRKRFRLISNKLAHVAPYFGVGAKMETGGFKLWREVLAGDPAARATMLEYNCQDVLVTEELYLRILPWIPGHPNRRLYGDPIGCPTCGATHLQRRGYAYTALSKFVKYQCQGCGAYFRQSTREHGVTVQEAVL